MIEIKAPAQLNFNDDILRVFLAGSIEMGKAQPWQDALVDECSDLDVIFYNPRRTDWDTSWTQDPTPGTQFHTQVTWELEHIEESDVVVFYFDPKTQSPITLMELGYALGSDLDTIVFCPKDYFRYGNVVITAQQNGTKVFTKHDEFVTELRRKLNELSR